MCFFSPQTTKRQKTLKPKTLKNPKSCLIEKKKGNTELEKTVRRTKKENISRQRQQIPKTFSPRVLRSLSLRDPKKKRRSFYYYCPSIQTETETGRSF